jgi:DNA-directed RNA polymerase subunit N (RpoN/RPB10)
MIVVPLIVFFFGWLVGWVAIVVETVGCGQHILSKYSRYLNCVMKNRKKGDHLTQMAYCDRRSVV